MIKQEKFGKLCKERMVNEILADLKDHPNFVITSYMGSSCTDLEQLRKSLKKSAADYLVVKNSILRIVFKELNLENESSKIDGGMGISFCGDDIVSTCKALSAFAKGHEKFKIKGAILYGQSVSESKISEIAALPSREVLIAQVVGGIKSPITGFVNTLGGIVRKVVYVVDAIKVKRSQTPAQPAEAK